jgi:hypothetical protein
MVKNNPCIDPSIEAALAIRSIASRLSPRARNARLRIIDAILASGHGCNIHVPTCPASPPEIEELVNRKAMVVDAAGNVNFVYPVSALPTHHRVTLSDGRHFSAMCAIDAMGAAFTFKQGITIHSECSTCHTPVHLELDAEHLHHVAPAHVHVLHMDLNRMDNWAASC